MAEDLEIRRLNETRWLRTRRAQERSLLHEQSIQDHEINELLALIDFGFLNRACQMEQQKSRTSLVDNQHTDQSSIFLMANDSSGNRQSERHSLIGLIELYPDNVRQRAEEYQLQLRTWVLFVVVHELVHNYSHTDIQGAKAFFEANSLSGMLKEMLLFWQKRTAKQMNVQSGYKRQDTTLLTSNDSFSSDRVQQHTTYENFDEGVTDKMALEILTEYAKLHPDFLTQTELDKLIFVLSEEKEASGHGKAIKLVDGVIADFSLRFGVSTDVVWEAIKNEKMGILSEDDNEIKQVLAQLPKNEQIEIL